MSEVKIVGAQFVVSTVMSFLGIGLAIGVLGVNIYNLIQNEKKYIPVLYLAVSGYYIYTLLNNLIRQSSGLVCAMPPLKTIVIYVGLALLHMYFLYDSVKLMKKR